jgi:hypothetical protein
VKKILFRAVAGFLGLASLFSANLFAQQLATLSRTIGGRHVTAEDIARARQHGATDKEIHDTVLIAAAFCMYNRYVDGLSTWAPDDPGLYRENGKRLAEEGYVHSTDLLLADAQK